MKDDHQEQVFCEQCGDCVICYYEDDCYFGGDHKAQAGEIESGEAEQLNDKRRQCER